MRSNSTRPIEAWFTKQSDDGDFVSASEPTCYTVIGPTNNADRIVFATKPALIATVICNSNERRSCGLIGHYGLPRASDIRWIRRLTEGHEVIFLGDLDPQDLMIFYWLRARLRPNAIHYLGICDSFLAELDVYLPESFVLKCSPSERRSLALLEGLFPDLNAVVGTKCAGILKRRRKIESQFRRLRVNSPPARIIGRTNSPLSGDRLNASCRQPIT